MQKICRRSRRSCKAVCKILRSEKSGTTIEILKIKQGVNQKRLRNVTESTIAPKELTTTVKFKNIPDEFADLKKLEIGASTTKEDALKTVKSNISSKIDELKKHIES